MATLQGRGGFDGAESPLLAGLTDVQREAVQHRDGPLLIVAGPGSGKTRVITARIAHLIQQGVHPAQVLAITFTNKAAGEMKRRVEAILPARGIWISTFHSFGARILRQYGERFEIDRNFTLYDQTDRLRMVKMAIDRANLDSARFTPDTLQGAISKAKNRLQSPDQYLRAEGDQYFTRVVTQVYTVYEKLMREANALDFDDLLYWPARCLQQDAELRHDLGSRFRYVMIDEYQDTNKAQYAIARGLTQEHQNLCVVGDPDQSIYKWRGSDIRNILDFERDFPSARIITMAENFRSTKAILRAADLLIANNKERKPKQLHTANADGVKPRILLFESGREEAELVVEEIRQVVAARKRRYRDFAILLRVNALSRALETAFVHQRVPFQIVRGLAFFDRKENRDILAYLKLLVNPRDDLAFLRAVNEPARGVGKTSLEHLQKYAVPRGLSLLAAAAELDKIPAIKGKAATGLRSFLLIMSDLRAVLDATPDEVIRQVLDRSGYRRMLKESPDPDDQDRLANVEELVTAAHQFHAEDTSRTISDFLENITLASDVDGYDQQQDCVAVMTLHTAKGLEFPVVYMLANEQGILPHERSLGNQSEIEEERRLAFVGMTRAQEELVLTHARLREFRGQTLYAVPSMFLGELGHEDMDSVDLSSSGSSPASQRYRDAAAVASRGWYDAGLQQPHRTPRPDASSGGATGYRAGLLVQHDVYGPGRITEVSGHGSLRKLKVRFKTVERTFIADKAALTIVTNQGTAP